MGYAIKAIRLFARYWFGSGFSRVCLIITSLLLANTAGVIAQDDDARGAILYATSGTFGTEGILYTLDPATGLVLTTVGPVQDAAGNSYGITGFKYDWTSGTVYGVTGRGSPTYPSSFVILDLSTALVTPIGPLDAIVTDVAINPRSGIIYALAEFDENFYSIDASTGQAVQIGSTGIDLTNQGGLAADRNGALFGVTDFSLYRFNQKTGKARLIGATGLRNLIKAAAFSPRHVMYGLEGGGGSDNPHLRWLVTFDLATGKGTRVGQINVGDLGALAFVPVKK
jgi:hypothetical protein